MKVIHHYNKRTFTIKATEMEINFICRQMAFEEGYQKGQGNENCSKLLELIRTTLEECETDWD